MMSVIGNSGIGGIKRQIFLSLGLLFSYSQLGAMACPQTVGPISTTEGIWSVLLRVAAAQNVIQSQICAIDCAVTTTSSSTGCICDCIQFGQSDIGAGGVYTINSPGVYCMYQDANWSAGAAITVNASNVTIDMQNHTLNGGSAGANGIVINGGHSDVTIKNGNIANPTSACIAKGGPDVILQNIIIQNINFSLVGGTTSVLAVSIQAGVGDNQFYNVLIENCTGYNSYILLNQGLSAVVRECVLTCDQTNGNASIMITGGASTNSLETAVIEDCIIKNVAAPGFGVVGSAIFDVANGLAVVIRNCKSYGSTSQGVNIVNMVDVAVSDCIVERSALDAFSFSAAIPGGAEFTSHVVVTNCVAQTTVAGAGVIAGFLFQTPGAAGFQSIVVTDCVAEAYGVGFLVTNAVVGKTIQPHFRNCYANANGVGFAIGLGSDPATALILDGSLVECIASNNSIYGFFLGVNSTTMNILRCNAIGNASDGYYVGCFRSYFETYASGNTGFGINNLGTAGGANTYVGCRAYGNIAGNYNGGLPNISVYPAGALTYMNNLSA